MKSRHLKHLLLSISTELKQVSTIGGAAFALLLGGDLVKSEDKSAIVIAIIAWWVFLQVVSHGILVYALSIENDGEDKS